MDDPSILDEAEQTHSLSAASPGLRIVWMVGLCGDFDPDWICQILATAFAPAKNWDEIGHLAAIAVIRTLLNFFLERDLAEMERHRKR